MLLLILKKQTKLRKQKDISFKKLNYKTLIEFESFLLKRGLKTNGISFHLRTLRAIYNRAINSNVASINDYPFKKYKIKNEKTIHRAISKEELKRIKNHKSDDKSVDFAKDCFMFSFYTRGMSFIDLANLKHENIHENTLQYRRSKTGQPFTIKLTDNALAIIEKYTNLNPNNSYVFPIIKHENRKYTEYRNALTLVNKKLKIIGKSINCSIPLTTYVARHSWATIAKHDGVSTSIISEGLGHATEHTTQIYLDSFGNDVIDKANDIITDLG